ncbi:proton-translocating NADH-quinone oxidoreductase subunit M [Flammeovirgaceae bacterium 311]|nr:proton-translocating NADH-quinone oxidoreductase subunit M [Flammeovirgaceae bacterium 311]
MDRQKLFCMEFTEHLLSLLIFVPLLAALVLLLIPARLSDAGRWVALIATAIQILLAVALWAGFRSGAGAPAGVFSPQGYQFVEKLEWFSLPLGEIGYLSADYFVGVDGLSVALVLLAAIVMFIGVISSWTIHQHQKGYFLLYLLLSSTVVGCFVALDLFLFYLFFEFMLLPMYFLIGMWGGPRRAYASIKFFLYTLAGSLFILIAIVGLYISGIDPVATAAHAGVDSAARVQLMLQEGSLNTRDMVHTFNMLYLMEPGNLIPGSLLSLQGGGAIWGHSVRLLAFLALMLGFAVKLPAVPVHTWLPDAHVEAPTPVSVVLAAILLKIGGYAILRIPYSLFPEGAIYYAPLVAGVGVLSILYGAFNALAQADLKKMIAYSSVSHMGYVLLGLAALTVEGVSGALYQMFSHGLISAALFLLVGVLYDRTHNRMIDNYGGLARRMPAFTVAVTITFFASLGLPGFSGFIAEALVFFGAFRSPSANGLLPYWMVIIAMLGLIITAAYYLWTLQRMFFGQFFVRELHWEGSLTDLTPREYFLLVPLLAGMLVLGLFPNLLLDSFTPAVDAFVQGVLERGRSNLVLLTRFL